MVTGDGVTTTAATGTAPTLIDAKPVDPPTVAEIVVAPSATAVTRPLASTVATPGSALDHAVARPPNASPVIMLPAESRGMEAS